ncbi:MAG: DUF459 domain-containing protein [Myxococcaceae bacterium]|nr:DUF459 domain-containing protein [Myxococcaceae bacterium]
MASAPPESADTIGAALTRLAEAGPPAPAQRSREYRVRDVALLLAVWAVLLLAFDSRAVLTWVERLDVGPAQDAWLSVVAPLHAALERAGLTAPRETAVAAGERAGAWLGVAEDPLLQGGWASGPGEPAPALAPLPPDALPEDELPLPVPSLAPPVLTPEPEPDADPLASPDEVAPKGLAVLLVGDSLIAGSLGAHVTRALARDRRLKVVPAYQTATGLSRPDVFDWMKVLPPLLERERPALVVCSFGANDATNIRTEHGTVVFAEAGWRQAYLGRVLAMMRQLTAGGARVLWLGLPPMRDANFSEKAQYLNRIFAQAARQVRGVEYLELSMLIADKQGEYVTFRRSPGGALVRYRLDDGVHYAPAGASAIARWVVDWIYERGRGLLRRPRRGRLTALRGAAPRRRRRRTSAPPPSR